MKISRPCEPILVLRKRFGYFLKSVLWRGQMYHIVGHAECRTVSNCVQSFTLQAEGAVVFSGSLR